MWKLKFKYNRNNKTVDFANEDNMIGSIYGQV